MRMAVHFCPCIRNGNDRQACLKYCQRASYSGRRGAILFSVLYINFVPLTCSWRLGSIIIDGLWILLCGYDDYRTNLRSRAVSVEEIIQGKLENAGSSRSHSIHAHLDGSSQTYLRSPLIILSQQPIKTVFCPKTDDHWISRLLASVTP